MSQCVGHDVEMNKCPGGCWETGSISDHCEGRVLMWISLPSVEWCLVVREVPRPRKNEWTAPVSQGEDAASVGNEWWDGELCQSGVTGIGRPFGI